MSNSSGVPIYRQIVAEVRRLIMTGVLQEGEALPSLRQLAKDLRISLITTKRAYEELESMGLLVSVGGKGCFVGAASPAKLAEEHQMELELYLQKAVQTAHAGGITLAVLQELTALFYGEIQEGDRKDG